MHRNTKIGLLEHWLNHPEDMGDIPLHMKDHVSADDFFQLKKEIGWKPFTEENVKKMLYKIKYVRMSGSGSNEIQLNPEARKAILIIIPLMIIFPLAVSLIGLSRLDYQYTGMLFTFLMVGLMFVGRIYRKQDKKK